MHSHSFAHVLIPLFLSLTDVRACTLPLGTLSNNITAGFAVQAQYREFPEIHNRFLNLWESGGGDQHLYLSPAGDDARDLTLDNGVLKHPGIKAVINGEYSVEDNTTKIFMTERNDPLALFDVVWGCNPDTDAVQTELLFRARGDLPGGFLCVRSASDNRHEFRYSPPGNTGESRDHIITLSSIRG